VKDSQSCEKRVHALIPAEADEWLSCPAIPISLKDYIDMQGTGERYKKMVIA